jgi:hypothetical protein
MVVAARRHERRLSAVSLRDLEAEDAAVKPQRTLQVGHLQMDVTDADEGIEGRSQLFGIHVAASLKIS